MGISEGGFDYTLINGDISLTDKYSMLPPVMGDGDSILKANRVWEETMDESSKYVNCVYWGIFFDEEDFPWRLHEKNVEHKHVTFGFKTPCPVSLIGTEVEVKVIGYGADDDNEAYEVALPSQIEDIYEGARPVHVTLSVSGTGRPVDSKNLPFYGMDKPFELKGTFGYFGYDSQVHLS